MLRAHADELAVAAHVDETGGVENLQVVGDGGCGNGKGAPEVAAAHLAARRDGAQDAEAGAVGEGLGDTDEVVVGHRRFDI